MNDIHNHNEERRKAIASNFEKAKKVPIGTIHNGLKKVAEGKWAPVKKKENGRVGKGPTSEKKSGLREKIDQSNEKKSDPVGKHYSEMDKSELLEAAKKLKIKTDGLTTAALRSKVGDKIVDAHVKAHTESKKDSFDPGKEDEKYFLKVLKDNPSKEEFLKKVKEDSDEESNPYDEKAASGWYSRMKDYYKEDGDVD